MSEIAFEVARLLDPLNTIAGTLTSAQSDIFILIPGLDGYFPMSLVGPTGVQRNHAGGTNTAIVGTPQAGFDGRPYAQLGNGTNYLSVPSGAFNITGAETFIEPSSRGMTMGGWFKADVLPPSAAGLCGRDGVPTNRGYSLVVFSTGGITFAISSDGTALTQVAAPANMAVGQWHFVVGRFTPSSELAVFIDGNKAVVTAGVPASMFVSTQAFEIGRDLNNNGRILTGKARDVFITRVAMPDDLIAKIRAGSLPA